MELSNDVIFTRNDIVLDIMHIPDTITKIYQENIKAFNTNKTAALIYISKKYEEYMTELEFKNEKLTIKFIYPSSDEIFYSSYCEYIEEYRKGNKELIVFIARLIDNTNHGIKFYDLVPYTIMNKTTYTTSQCSHTITFKCNAKCIP